MQQPRDRGTDPAPSPVMRATLPLTELGPPTLPPRHVPVQRWRSTSCRACFGGGGSSHRAQRCAAISHWTADRRANIKRFRVRRAAEAQITCARPCLRSARSPERTSTEPDPLGRSAAAGQDAPTDETARAGRADPPERPGGGGAASDFCHCWHSLVVNEVSVGSICTICGFFVIALSTMSSPLTRFQ